MSDQLATIKQSLNSEVVLKQFATALPKHLSPERFVRIAITAMMRNPKLAECSQASVMRCLLDLSAMGLEPDGRRAHLIPFENKRQGTVECTLIVDFKGIVELVRRDPNVLDVQAYTVRENDSIIVRNGIPEHNFNPAKDRGKVVAVYSKIVWKNGTTTYGEPMSWPEAESVRNRSKAWHSFLQYKKEGPWNTDETEMWKKTVIRRDSKMWPLPPDIRDAIERDDDQILHQRDVTPATTGRERLKALREKKADDMQPAEEEVLPVTEEPPQESPDLDILQDFLVGVAEAQDADELNQSARHSEDFEGASRKTARQAIKSKAEELGLVYDGDAKEFVKKGGAK
jgi:recombination protein RecT